MDKIKELVLSRKFWVAVASVIGGFATDGKAFMPKAVAIVCSWLVAQGGVDALKLFAGSQEKK